MEIQNLNFEFKNSIVAIFNNGKSIKISGEWTTSPAFYADLSSIKKWESPNEEIPLSNSNKYEIIKNVIEFSRKKGITPVYFS